MKALVQLLGSTSFAQLLLILVSPLLSRIYSPAHFGDFLIITSWLYIINSIAQGRMDIALLTAKDENEIKSIFSIGLSIIITYSILSILILVILDTKLNLPNFYYMLPVMVFSLSFYQLIVALYLRKNDIKFVVRNKITQSLTLSTGQISLGYLYPSVYSLGISQIVSFIATCFLSIKIWKPYFIIINPIKNYNKYKNFILFDSVSNLFQMLSKHLPPILITYLLGGVVGGFYYMAFRILMMPVAVFSVSINQIISSQYNNHKDRRKEWTRKNSKALLVTAIIFFIPFALLSTYITKIFPFVFGADWVVTGELIKYFCGWIFLLLIYGSFSINFSLDQKSDIKMAIDIFAFTVNILTILTLWNLNYNYIIFLKIYANINILIYLLAILVLNFKNDFNIVLNFIVILLSTLFIISYWKFENIFYSIVLVFVFIIILINAYKKRYL